jgi:hypothetical protein
MKYAAAVLVGMVLFTACGVALGQEGQKAPEKPRIEKIEGDCEYRASDDADWVKAAAGQAVETGGSLCTGFDSTVVVHFPGNSTLEAGPLTQVSISTFFDAKAQLEARLKVTVGSVRVRVERGDVQSDFQVSTPHTTTSVKGTDWEVTTSYYGDKIVVHENTIKAKNALDRSVAVEEENKTDEELQPSADVERRETVKPVVPNGSTDEEASVSTEEPGNEDMTPSEQTSYTNPDKERQSVYHSGP